MLTQARLEAAYRQFETLSFTGMKELSARLQAVDSFACASQAQHSLDLYQDARHSLQTIRDSANRMAQLLENIIGFSRVDQELFINQVVSMEPLVHSALQGLEAERRGRAVEIAVSEMPAGRGDPSLLKLVWANLLSNALKFTRPRARARIHVGQESRNGIPVYFVRDNGVGFDMQYSDKLFVIFQRLHRAEQFEGLGVGLALVHRIVGCHGGRVWAHAMKNRGATFYFTLWDASQV